MDNSGRCRAGTALNTPSVNSTPSLGPRSVNPPVASFTDYGVVASGNPQPCWYRVLSTAGNSGLTTGKGEYYDIKTCSARGSGVHSLCLRITDTAYAPCALPALSTCPRGTCRIRLCPPVHRSSSPTWTYPWLFLHWYALLMCQRAFSSLLCCRSASFFCF